MNASRLAKLAVACTLALGFATVTPTYAQTTEGTAPQAQNQADDDSDYGWIGLLGLIGLAGLMGRKRDSHHYDTRGATPTR